jgi:hypothetical protein
LISWSPRLSSPAIKASNLLGKLLEQQAWMSSRKLTGSRAWSGRDSRAVVACGRAREIA